MQVGALFGRYRLERRLSRDVMGEVWSAFDTVDDRRVALRALPEEAADDDDYRDRFEREAAIAAGIDDPHVAPVHDHGQIGNRLYLAMPILNGTDLRTQLEYGGPMEVFRAIDVVVQVATALAAVHAAGLIDQEVTASNVLVQDDGHVYLTDVGLPTDPGEASGVFGLTALLYECVTGQSYPWSAGPKPPRPSEIDPALPIALDEVIARGTAPDRARRYGSGSELVAAARAAAMRGQPVDPVVGSVVPFAMNRRVVLASLAAAAVVVIAVVIGLVVGSGPSPDVVSTGQSEAGTSPSEQPVASPTDAQPAAANPPAAPPPIEPPPAPVPNTAYLDAPEPAPVQPIVPRVAPAPAPAPMPAAPNVLPCYPGYVHTPPPDGPCLPPGSPVQQQQAPAPAAPNVLPCYAGYVHTPPPDGPCLPAGSPVQQQPAPAPPPAPAPAAPNVLPCYPGYVHTPPPDGPCLPPGR
ncbi:MAG: serine/threonine protein kinase [Aldersonia sp.]|nr:serine/threonine protein kinase [Aldersonia sp.]